LQQLSTTSSLQRALFASIMQRQDASSPAPVTVEAASGLRLKISATMAETPLISGKQQQHLAHGFQRRVQDVEEPGSASRRHSKTGRVLARVAVREKHVEERRC
jgi:hypothetical protein